MENNTLYRRLDLICNPLKQTIGSVFSFIDYIQKKGCNNMLKLTWMEFFLRTIPETFILIWSIHVISRKSFNMPKYILSSILLSIITFFVRWLPIYFGIHMIVNIVITISIMVIIEISLIKSIYSTFLTYFIFSLCEFFNMILLRILNINTSIDVLSPFIKCIYGIPSLIFLSLFIIIISYLLKLKEGTKNVSN